jgi:transposase
MNEAITYRIGFDVAKGVFQAHAVKNEPGEPVAFRKRLKSAGGGVVRQAAALADRHGGVRLGALLGARGAALRARGAADAAYVKAYVKRNKTDALDAEAISEAVGRPTMRFVPVKGEADRTWPRCGPDR